MRKSAFALAFAPITIAVAAPASAATTTDPIGDFLPSYNGPQTGEFDVTNFSVLYDPAAQFFRVAGTLAGNIDPETDGYYIIGVNTGAGAIDPFDSIGQGNVTFDKVAIVAGEGEAFIGPNDLTFDIFGNNFVVLIPLSLLGPGTTDPLNFGFNLWPRTEIDTPGVLEHISDFAPNNSLLKPSAVPEPMTWLTMLLGFALTGGALRFRRAKKAGLQLV